MNIAEEIRVWGARQPDSDYWGTSAYSSFIDELKWKSDVRLDGEKVTIISETATDEDYDGDIQIVFTVGDRVFAMDGTYSSWSGNNWQGEPYEVEAQPVTKIEYVRKR